MTTQRKIEANRRNAQKSTGPRTVEGKSKVKLNALKHGMTAATVVLPHEDAAAYERRLETWTRELNPPGEMGQYLAERVVRISWQLDRADFHERDQACQTASRSAGGAGPGPWRGRESLDEPALRSGRGAREDRPSRGPGLQP